MRDEEVNKRLEKDGWTVMRFWGEEIQKDVCKCADEICKALSEK